MIWFLVNMCCLSFIAGVLTPVAAVPLQLSGVATTCATVLANDGTPFKCPVGKAYVSGYTTVAIPQSDTTDADIEQTCCVSCGFEGSLDAWQRPWLFTVL